MKKLAPVMYSPKHNRKVPITDVFEDILTIINRDTQQAKEYKKKLLGNSIIESAPDEYWELGMIRSLGLLPDQWGNLDLHTRAKIRAQFQLSNMAEIIKHHYELREQGIRNALSRSNGKN